MHKAEPGLVTIIIPIYRAKLYIAETLDSVKAQTYPKIETIAIEDGLSETSEEIVRQYPDVIYLSQSNKGNSSTRNRGIKLARGEYIAFLDCDDIYPADKIEVQVKYLESHPEVMIVSGLTHEFNHPGTTTPNWMRENGRLNNHKGSPPGAWLVRREAFEKVGLFNEDFVSASDTDWLMRAKKAGINLEFVPKVVLNKRNHANNQSAHASPAEVLNYHRELTHIFKRK